MKYFAKISFVLLFFASNIHSSCPQFVFNPCREDELRSCIDQFLRSCERCGVGIELLKRLSDVQIQVSSMKSEGTLGLFTPPDKLAYENTLEIEINVDKIKQYRSYVNTTLFHELVHALHFHKDRGGFWDRRLTKDFTTICKRANFSKKSAETLRKGYPNAEELKTKVGIYVDNDGIVKYDPVNENGFLYSMCGALQLEYNGELSPDVKKFFTEMVMTGRIPEPISQLDVVIEEWQDYIIFIISIIIILIFLMLHILKKRKKPRIRIVINR